MTRKPRKRAATRNTATPSTDGAHGIGVGAVLRALAQYDIDADGAVAALSDEIQRVIERALDRAPITEEHDAIAVLQQIARDDPTIHDTLTERMPYLADHCLDNASDADIRRQCSARDIALFQEGDDIAVDDVPDAVMADNPALYDAELLVTEWLRYRDPDRAIPLLQRLADRVRYEQGGQLVSR